MEDGYVVYYRVLCSLVENSFQAIKMVRNGRRDMSEHSRQEVRGIKGVDEETQRKFQVWCCVGSGHKWKDSGRHTGRWRRICMPALMPD